ncbi:MAG TPA: hypothetical protein VGQ83_02435 [Polyangia bacterium]
MSDRSDRVLVCVADDEPAVGAAARAVAGALELAGASVRPLDLRAAVGPAPLRRVADLLGKVSERTLSGALAAVGASRFGAELAAAPPGVLVVLDPIAAEAALEWRRGGRVAAPILGVALDLEPAAWKGIEVDRLAVADELAAEVAGPAPAERPVTTGVPVAPEVAAAAREDRAALRARFGLGEGRRLVLCDARELDHDTLGGILLQLGLTAGRADVVFDAGADPATAAYLRSQAPLHGLRARMFGAVPEAPLYWRAADLAVVGPEREAVLRALALGVVTVVLASPDDAGGLALGRAVEARGAGALAPSVLRLGATLELALHEDRFERARAAAATRARPEAAGAVAALALRLAAERPAPAAATAPRDRRVAPAGALEEIGAGATASRPPSAEEAKVRLTALEAPAQQAQRRLEETERELAKWEKRARLSAGRGDAALEEAARREVETCRNAAAATRAELDRLAEERARLEALAAGPATRPTAAPRAADREADYRRMEIEDELAALKDKLGKPKK